MKQLIHPKDPYQMNWIAGKTPWGTVRCPDGLSCRRETKETDGQIRERYLFRNETGRDLFLSLTDVAIYTPFSDNYEQAGICMTQRCHAHIWCGGEVSYIMALRMGAKGPHLGLILTKGSLGGYSVERDLSKISNDRGDFLLHPSPFSLAPGESTEIEWTLFWHEGKADFFETCRRFPRYIGISMEQAVFFLGESVRFWVEPARPCKKDEIVITRQGRPVAFTLCDGRALVEEPAGQPGEWTYSISVKGVRTWCRVLVQPPLEALLSARCRFLVENQQYRREGSRLDGAFLIYDNEEGRVHYDPDYDHNAGRERVCMGILLAAYLQKHPDRELEEGLDRYLSFVYRELYDETTGEVFNDAGRDNHFFRLYNYPWMALFFLEVYEQKGDRRYLEDAMKTLTAFYEKGGGRFYAIEVPVEKTMACLRREGMEGQAAELEAHLSRHAAFLMQKGTDYPAHEVNYEQSIVAPAANLLFELYRATGKKEYLEGAKEQLTVLELFNGLQPDHHLFQVAIRHWDGYWFGKNRMYGDTFPHYWSFLTGKAYAYYAKAGGDPSYLQKAQAALRGVLSLFSPDGRASCAMVYPVTVNGVRSGGYDPWANDQDWGLYAMLRYGMPAEKERLRPE